MELIEQTSTQLLLKDSSTRVLLIRLVCTPFLMFGILGLFIVITEKVFPSLFIIFCLLVGILGVFFTSHQTIYLDKNQNKLTLKTKRLFGTKKAEYPLDNLNIRVQRTSFQVKTYSSILISQKEPIYIVVLEIPSASKTIKISSNYSLLQNQALEIANQIRTFLDIPP